MFVRSNDGGRNYDLQRFSKECHYVLEHRYQTCCPKHAVDLSGMLVLWCEKSSEDLEGSRWVYGLKLILLMIMIEDGLERNYPL